MKNKMVAGLFAVAVTFAVAGCGILPGAQSIYEGWQKICGKELAQRPEVQAEAKARGASFDALAEAFCEIPDVVAPFMRASRPGEKSVTLPADESINKARELGLIR